MTVIDEIAAERRRQIEVECWTPEYDDRHKHGDLANAAACYAVGGGIFRVETNVPLQVWPDGWGWSPKDKRRDLIRAAALLVAEIERLDRKDAALRARSPAP